MIQTLVAGSSEAKEIEQLAAPQRYAEETWWVDPDGSVLHSIVFHAHGCAWASTGVCKCTYLDTYQIVDRPVPAPSSPDLSHVHTPHRGRVPG